MNWQPGDLALCVLKVTKSGEARTGIRRGGIYTVSEVVFSERSGVGLRFVGKPNLGGRLNAIPAYGFVKITPGHQIKGIEAEKRLPSKVGQDA